MARPILTAGESWIIDGNYGGTFDLRFSRADTVIVLTSPTKIKAFISYVGDSSR